MSEKLEKPEPSAETEPQIKDFESALTELEALVTQLEDGSLTLETSLALFERGVTLSRYCHGKLDEAERRLEVLTERGHTRPAPAALSSIGLDDSDE